MSKTLFDQTHAGAILLKNRVVMAPLTRCRADDDGVPTDLMARYYTQRASAGFIITESTAISKTARGWKNAPGLYTQDQGQGWQKLVEQVHAAGGKIVLQLWHAGDAGHFDFQDSQNALVDPALRGAASYSLEDIANITQDFIVAATRAQQAGFDGVEIHAAYGFLLDGFLQPALNKRTDAYGGSLENRLRLTKEICSAVAATLGADRVGLRLSCDSSSDHQSLLAAASCAQDLNLAYVHLAAKTPLDLRPVFSGTLIVGGGLNLSSAQRLLNNHQADAVSFGRAFIANPDLVTRLRQESKLNTADPETYLKGAAKGYTDYPCLRF